MPRYRADIAYDGTPFSGFQLQPGKPTVQSLLEEALRSFTGVATRVHPSGRTDAGVHARGQVIHFDSDAARAVPDFYRGLNALLPPEIRVNAVRLARPDFHARFDAVRKEYRYFIWNHRVLEPFHRPFRAHVPFALDVEAMRAAARVLCGRHDFAAFTANARREVGDTTRTLDLLEVRASGALLTIRAGADGFLYKMVRSLVGLLMRAGEGHAPPAEVQRILASRQRDRQVPTAPAHGLFLWQVWYRRAKGGGRQPVADDTEE